MSPYSYTNQAGYRFPLPEQPLEPSDCWGAKKENGEEDEDDFV